MATGFRPKLGLALQNAILPGDQPDYGTGDFTPPQPKGGFFRDGGMGRYLAGAIGDALLQHADMAPVFAPMQRQKQALAAEEAQWSRRRAADNADWQARKQWELNNKPTEVPPIVQSARAWQTMTDAERQAYGAMQTAQRGDPFVTTTLPNGQFYAGPQSGLIGALTGATQAIAPKGKLGPVVDTIPGGPQVRPAGPFRP